MLERINSSEDLKKLHIDELEKLADEIRQKIIHTTLQNGGHLAANLGTVELTLALHYVFDTPEDKLIFDVGHQCYTHKLITGRRDRFDTLRTQGGLSGFPNHRESEYDTFDAGHASSSLSQALGLARARDVAGEDYQVVALIGDGAISGGMALEALNDAGSSPNTRLIIVLNDNEMSISQNVGGLSKHFSKLRVTRGYVVSKKKVKKALQKISHSGRLVNMVTHLRNSLRYFLIGETIFDAMGIKYLGPVNGHSIKETVDALKRAKEYPGPVIVHAVTCKGCGFEKAEENPEKYHGISPSGAHSSLSAVVYAKQLGITLSRLAESDPRVCAITAGMTYNTGLKAFSEAYPDRFFDTGIAEQHALGMAGGLAKGGLRPFVVIYSTFLQRGLDQVFHDICLQQLPVTICVDHAGLVGEDGPTHQGVFDLGFLRAMPGLTVLTPRDPWEFDRMLSYALNVSGPVAIRYPKGSCSEISGSKPFASPDWEELRPGEKGAVLAYGAMIGEAEKVAEALHYRLIDARSQKPLDETMLLNIADLPIVVMEDCAAAGSLGEAVAAFYGERRLSVRLYAFALRDDFISVADVRQQREENGISAEAVLKALAGERAHET